MAAKAPSYRALRPRRAVQREYRDPIIVAAKRALRQAAEDDHKIRDVAQQNVRSRIPDALYGHLFCYAPTALRLEWLGRALDLYVPDKGDEIRVDVLLAAIQFDRVEYVRAVIRSGVPRHPLGFFMSSPLTMALLDGKFDSARCLAAEGFVLTRSTLDFEDTILRDLANKPAAVAVILELFPHRSQRQLQEALVTAASAGCVESINMLCRHGADVNCPELALGSGNRPLGAIFGNGREYAIHRYRAAVDTLLENGADPMSVPELVYQLRPYLHTPKLQRARLQIWLVPLMAACARGDIFNARFYDAALWRLVERFT
jgi:hypothetical protein